MRKITLLLILLLIPFAYANEAEDVEGILDKVDLSELPGTLKFLLGKPLINIEITDTETVYGFKIDGEIITDFVNKGVEKPNYLIKLDNSTLNELLYADDPMNKATDFYSEGDIVIEPKTFGSKIKFKIASWFM